MVGAKHGPSPQLTHLHLHERREGRNQVKKKTKKTKKTKKKKLRK